MDPRISRIARTMGFSEDGGNCPVGHRWFDDEELLTRYDRMAKVFEYMEAEFDIPSNSELPQFRSFLDDLHTAFAWRLHRGEVLEKIQLPMDEIAGVYKFSFWDRISPEVFAEAFRRQFK